VHAGPTVSRHAQHLRGRVPRCRWRAGGHLVGTGVNGLFTGRRHTTKLASVVTTLSEPDDDGDFNEVDFVNFLRRLLEARYPCHRITQEDRGIDLLIDRGGEYTIVEAKRVSPQTSSRIDRAAEQLWGYRERMRGVSPSAKFNLALAIPSLLSSGRLDAFRRLEIDVWDRDWILSAAVEAGMEDEATRFIGGRPSRRLKSPSQELRKRLEAIHPGRVQWPEYQKLCGEILDYLFCPPLATPISERTNEAETNRRDFILPNYANSGFWAFLRGRYGADHVVVDAKNYTDEIKKTEVLQLANYLSLHGPGHFGIIITRNGADNSAIVTRREQWTVYSKLILILNDEDIKQMLEAKGAPGEADLLIRQKIEDFRLSI
jgi:hypothetical protein